MNGQRTEASEIERSNADGAVQVERKFAQTREQLLERDPHFEPRERRSQAMMNAHVEGDMSLFLAVNVEHIRRLEAALIPIG